MSVSAWRKEYEEACAKHGKDEVARAMHRPEVLESIKSGESLDTVLESLKSINSPFSHEHMEQILSPTMDSQDETNTTPAFSMDSEISSAYSADSIIRRVEEEIANARRAVTMKHNKGGSHYLYPPDDDGDESSEEKKLEPPDDAHHHSRTPSPDKQLQTAMDDIGDEFKERDLEEPKVGGNGDTCPFDEGDVLFSDEEWQQQEPSWKAKAREKTRRAMANVLPSVESFESALQEADSEEFDQTSKILSTRPPLSPREPEMFQTTHLRAHDRLDGNVDEDENGLVRNEDGDIDIHLRLEGSKDLNASMSSQENPNLSEVQSPNSETTGSYKKSFDDANNDATTASDSFGSVDAPEEPLEKTPTPRQEMSHTRRVLGSMRERRELAGSVRSPSNSRAIPLTQDDTRSPTTRMADDGSASTPKRSGKGEGGFEDSVAVSKRPPTTAAIEAKLAFGGFDKQSSSPEKLRIKTERRSPVEKRPAVADRPNVDRPPTNERQSSGSPRRMIARAAAFQLERLPTSSLPLNDLGASSPVAPPPIDASPRSRRIRFRDPYPVIKPPEALREGEEIIKEFSLGVPSFPTRWVKPKTDLKQLIVAAMGHSLPRRANSCGTLKVLTQSKKNRMTMVRTDSFLTALVFTANQEIPSFRERELALDARTRAVACIKNICEQKDNRVIVLTYPGVLECLTLVIQDDRGEARLLACGAVALLAKTPSCRETLVLCENLVTTLAYVLSGTTSDSKMWACNKKQLSRKEPSIDEKDGDESIVSDNSHSIVESVASDHENSNADDGSVSTASSLSVADSVLRAKAPPLERMDSIRQQNEEKGEEFLRRARSNACAAILHLSKHCAVLVTLCANSTLLDSLVAVSKEYTLPIHSKCLEILANLSRFPANASRMTSYNNLVPTLTAAAHSEDANARMYALRCFQNLSADSTSKPQLANDTILSLMTSCAMRKSPDEKEAAVATLYNLSTEPGAVVAITNTKNVVATLVHLAHNAESAPDIRFMACEALATISLWLQTLAGTGKIPREGPNIALPSQKTSGWDRWE